MELLESVLSRNYIFLDISNKIEKYLRYGQSIQDITSNLEREYEFLAGDICQETIFWLSLADIQWNWGVLLPRVKSIALASIKTAKFDRVFIGIFTSLEEQNEFFELIGTKLLSPMPEFINPVKKGLYRCKWEIGDVFAYKLLSSKAEEAGISNQYFLIQKVDECFWHPGHVVPIVYVKITSDGRLPLTIEEYDNLAFVQTGFTKYENRFLPIDGRCPDFDIQRKRRLNYVTDEFGFLPEYRIILLNTSEKIIPKSLKYVGNFLNAKPPEIEFVPHVHHNISDISWRKRGYAFEARLIDAYCNHNKRKLSIYSQDS